MDNDKIMHLAGLLGTYRKNVRQLLEQKRMYGDKDVPNIITNSIASGREKIAELKRDLYALEVVINDEPEDKAQKLPMGTKVTIEIDNENTILRMPNAMYATIKMIMQQDYGIDVKKYVIE